MHQLQVNPDGSEQLEYTMTGLPVRISTDRLRIFQDYAAACHWHDDLEILAALDGEMDYFVNNKKIHLKKGDGIFVNARRLHYGYSEKKEDCLYRFVVFHPSLLGNDAVVQEAISQFTGDTQPDYWHLDASSEGMLTFHSLYAAAEVGDALQVLFHIAGLLNGLRQREANQSMGESKIDWQLLRRMTGYIQGHYDEPITLQAIAASGAVCRSRCCALFRGHLGMTPMEYVTRYRLDKACSLLREGTNVTEAALACGFHGSSYFAEVFKRTWNITPREYQRNYFQQSVHE
ncbi:MAG: helix-turn-helix transcriptional regulator [Clostridia bacterium]|nr:helix-turn-helix transcriptional regulator [Clostridia bacterium]